MKVHRTFPRWMVELTVLAAVLAVMAWLSTVRLP